MNDESFDRPHRKAVALDPHPLCHTALATLLARFDIDLVGAATSTRTAETLLQEHQPDLLVMEIDLAEGHEAALRMISSGRNRCPQLTVIVLSGTSDRCVIDAAFDSGAAAYVLKTSDAGRDRHGDPAGVRAVRLPGTAAGAPGPDDGQPAAREADPPRARDPPACLRRSLEPAGRGDPLGRRPDGEVPPREHLPQARRPQPLRGGALGARERDSRRRGRARLGGSDVRRLGERRRLTRARSAQEPADAAEGRYRKVRGNIAMTPNEYCRVRAPRH